MIAIIDYGAGNTRSVMNALDRLQADYILTDDSSEILESNKVIFPGVGHAGHAMDSLKTKGLDTVISEISQPLLGICIGMQLLYEYSEEGGTNCLGIVSGQVHRFAEDGLIIPQMGWNGLSALKGSLFNGIDEQSYFYSVHSYRAGVTDQTIATADYGGLYSAAIQKDNFYGVQFHPEKSGELGRQLLQNFLRL